MERSAVSTQECKLPNIGIPAEILFHPKLTNTEKILYGFIRNLSRGENGCYASNTWLADLIGMKTWTVSTAISNLVEYEVINIIYDNTKIKRTRKIHLNPDYLKVYNNLIQKEGFGKFTQGVVKIHNSMCENSQGGHVENHIGSCENSQGIYYPLGNTEDVSKDVSKKKKGVDVKTRALKTIYKNVPKDWSEDNNFYESLLSYLNHRKQKNQTPTVEAGRRMGLKFSQHSIQTVIQALDESVSNGWIGVFPESVKNNRSKQTVTSGSRKFGVKSKYREPDKVIKKQETNENI